MSRLITAAALVAMLGSPLEVQAAPTPSPSLGKVLAEPIASGFVEVTAGQGPVEGPITASEIAQAGGSPNEDELSLRQDGFIAAYGRTWVDNVNKHELQELVIAFSGGAGAHKWLGSSKKTDTTNQYFVHELAVDGIGPYYGAHLANPPQSEYVDIVGFVKGNDYFLVAAASVKDDLDQPIATQAKGQYDFAPSNTIPPSQWPEHPLGAMAQLGELAQTYAPYAAIVVVLFLLAVSAFFLIRRRRRGAAIGDVQMSPDGTYWWDGGAWRDASNEAPPAALRSNDGYYWWDGRMWRLMPEPPATGAAPAVEG